MGLLLLYIDEIFKKLRQNVICFLGGEVKGHLGATGQVILYFSYSNKYFVKNHIYLPHCPKTGKDVMPMIVQGL